MQSLVILRCVVHFLWHVREPNTYNFASTRYPHQQQHCGIATLVKAYGWLCRSVCCQERSREYTAYMSTGAPSRAGQTHSCLPAAAPAVAACLPMPLTLLDPCAYAWWFATAGAAHSASTASLPCPPRALKPKLRSLPIKVKAVEVDAPGCSYHPDSEAHQVGVGVD